MIVVFSEVFLRLVLSRGKLKQIERLNVRDIPEAEIKLLTLILPIATIVPYANSLDPDETPSKSASHPDPSCLTLGRQFNKI